jgi:hypothetical protein
MTIGYDIIGDIHGHHDKLVMLLQKLGYRESAGAWRHPGRVAIFVGDLIDRGPKQVDTVMLVRRMVDAGSARCIMGNHEFNAVAWSMPDSENPGEFLRPHGKPSNRKQHAGFLAEVEGKPIHTEILDWIRALPLWIDEPGIRVVHACWHTPSIEWLRPRCREGGTLSPELFESGSRKGTPDFRAIETLCKGLEVDLPNGISFYDKDGTERRSARIRWWEKDLVSFRQAAIGPPDLTERIPDVAFPESQRPETYRGPPVFFGHYWFTGEPRVLGGNAACLDYSVGNGGPLVAYRWDGEQTLRAENFRSAGGSE